MSEPRLLVVVPTYNEAANLPNIVARTLAAVPLAHMLIVDDASPDGTGEIAESIAVADARVTVMHRVLKDGLGRAYLSGFRSALSGNDYDLIAEMDADGSHDPGELPAMVQLAQNADIVIGSRWVPGGTVEDWPWYRKAISRTANWYASFMLRTKIKDITAGFRIFRAEALRELTLEEISSQGYCFQIDLAWRAERSGMRIVEHPIRFTERTEGASKMSLGVVIEALWRVTTWGLRPPKLATPQQPQL